MHYGLECAARSTDENQSIVRAIAKTAIPGTVYDVFPAVLLVGFALSGLAIGATGAFLPARRAASARIAPVLQAE